MTIRVQTVSTLIPVLSRAGVRLCFLCLFFLSSYPSFGQTLEMECKPARTRDRITVTYSYDFNAFAVMATLVESGWEYEQSGHFSPLHGRFLRLTRNADPRLRKDLSEYAQKNKLLEGDMGITVIFGVLTSGPSDYNWDNAKVALYLQNNPDLKDAEGVKKMFDQILPDFAGLLRKVTTGLDLQGVYEKLSPDHGRRWNPAVICKLQARADALVDYLRWPKDRPLPIQQVSIIPLGLWPRYSSFSLRLGTTLYDFQGPQSSTPIKPSEYDPHEVLHTLLDEFLPGALQKHGLLVEQRVKAIWDRIPEGTRETYSTPESYIEETIVRVISKSYMKSAARTPRTVFDYDRDSGFFYVDYFHGMLSAYEKQTIAFSDFLDRAIKGLPALSR